MIAKTGSPHTIGEKLILPCVKEVIETVMCQSSTPVLSTVPLSNDTVQRCIDEMGDDVESQLVQILSRTDHALQIDESTVRDNEALLMGSVSGALYNVLHWYPFNFVEILDSLK